MASSCIAAKSVTEKSNRIQNQAMCMMTGAMHSTLISALETVTGLQSLEDRSSIKMPTQAAKFERLTEHPMHNRLSKPAKGRLTRSSFIHHSRILERHQPELLENQQPRYQPTLTRPKRELFSFLLPFQNLMLSKTPKERAK